MPDDKNLVGEGVDLDESQLNKNTVDGFDNEDDDEDELNAVKLRSMPPVNVTATDWTTETILSQLKKGNINISPKFQRRDAWSAEHKSRFIESLFLGLPIPQVILAEQEGRRGKYIVIDGKQRLLSLRQFAATRDDGFAQLKLKKLDIKTELNGMTLEDIEQDMMLSDDLTAFQNQTIRTVVVRNWHDEEFLYLLFLRLNTGSVRLSPQELRQALHPGPFIDYVDEFTLASDTVMKMLNLKKPDFRMRDVELVIRYYAFRNYLHKYSGDLKSFLDMACHNLNDLWSVHEDAIRRQARELEMAIQITDEIFDGKGFRKWIGDRFESRFNRALFDIMVFYFSNSQIAEAAKSNKEQLVEAFKQICITNREFLSSIESTTKSVTATFTRLNVWAETLRECTDVIVPVPVLDEGRISVNGMVK